MDKTIRFGIIGCGMIAGIHAKAIESLENARLVGAVDYQPDRAAQFAREHDITAYPNAAAMLADEQIDAVCICTPSAFHADTALTALAHHKHVVLEKPMALDSKTADQVVAACEQNHCLLTVISQLRFSQDVQRVKQLLEENAFGRITMCSLYMKYWRDQEYYASSSWKGTLRFDGGGALMNQGIHGIDLLQYLMGVPRVVSGLTKTLTHDIEVEDTAAALLEFENGAIGVVEAATSAYPGFDRRLEIVGDRGHVILQENTIQQLVMDCKPVELFPRQPASVNTSSDPTVLDYQMHARQIQNLIEAVHGREALLIDAAEGRKAVKIIEHIYSFCRK